MSALGETVELLVEELFAPFGSLDVVVTDAVFMTGFGVR
jgi:hypothetical protein